MVRCSISGASVLVHTKEIIMETRKMFFSRRNLLKGSAASLAATALGSSSTAFAQQSSAPTIRPLTGKMTYEEVRNRAREMMIPRCYVCPECNGRGPSRFQYQNDKAEALSPRQI